MCASKTMLTLRSTNHPHWGPLGIEPRTSRKFDVAEKLLTQSENYTTKL